MSIAVMTLVWDSDVRAPERFTLLALADRGDDDGKCWPSVRWLARKCQTSDRTIRRHLSWLESEHLIRRAARLNDSSVYRIQVQALRRRKLPEDPCQSVTPGQDDTPDDVSGGDDMSGGTDCQGVTKPVDDPCQIDPQSFSDPSLTTSSSTAAALAVAPKGVPASPDVEALCAHLCDLIVANGSKARVSQTWRAAARLMIERDGRDIAEAHRLIDWCQADSFWMGNVLSMPTFRKQYDKLRLKASAGRHLSAVQNSTPAAASFEALRQQADAQGAARLIGELWREPSKPPQDKTPIREWLHARRVEWIDQHEQQIRAALASQRSTA